MAERYETAPDTPEEPHTEAFHPEGELHGLLESLEGRIAEREATRWGRLRERLTSRPLARRRTWLWALALALPALMVLAPRPDWRVAPGLQLGAVLLFCVALSLPLLSRALRGWHQPAPGTAATALWVVGSLVGLAALWALPPSHVHLPLTAVPEGVSPLRPLFGCLTLGASFAVPVYLVARWLGRGSPRSHLFAAAGAGLAANVALLLHCPLTEPSHLVPAHAGVLALALALAWLWGGRSTPAAPPKT